MAVLRPIGRLGCYCIYFFRPSKTNAQKMKVIHFYKKITCYFMVKSKKCYFGRLAADWPFGMLLHLFFPAIKNKCSENESNSFLPKNHLLFYDQVQKMPFQPIGGRSNSPNGQSAANRPKWYFLDLTIKEQVIYL